MAHPNRFENRAIDRCLEFRPLLKIPLGHTPKLLLHETGLKFVSRVSSGERKQNKGKTILENWVSRAPQFPMHNLLDFVFWDLV